MNDSCFFMFYVFVCFVNSTKRKNVSAFWDSPRQLKARALNI